MLTLAPYFLTSLAVSLALVPVCRALSIRFGKVAAPREDRWHRRTVALFGGVAIGVTLFAGTLVTGVYRDLALIVACGAGMFATGLVDDIIAMKPATKLIAQIAFASVLLFFGYRLNWLNSITGDLLLTLVWVVGVTNAFNLLDNMDGLCAGIALVVGGTLLVDLFPQGHETIAFVEAKYLSMLLGATAGFLVYNFNPASIFMGDSGSLLLGFSFGALTLTSQAETAGRSNLLSVVAVPVLVLLIPIFDTTLVTVLRWLSGRSASTGGRDHSSHRLVAIGLSERTAVVVLWLLAGMGGAIAIAIRRSQSWGALVAVLFLTAMVLLAVYLARIRVYEGEDARRLREGSVTPLVVDFMYKRRVAEVLLDFVLISLAYYAAYRLRFEGEEFLHNFDIFKKSLPIVLSLQMIAFFAVGVYRGIWRYFSTSDGLVVFKGAAIGTGASLVVILYLYKFLGYSRTVFAIDAVLVTALVIASRVSFRLIGEFVQRQRQTGYRVIIYGAGDGGSLAVRELLNRRDTAVRILGFIDDDVRKVGTRVQGYRVLGDINALLAIVEAQGVDGVVISAGAVAGDRIRRLAAACGENHVELSRLRIGLEELNVPDEEIAAEGESRRPARSIAFRPRGR